jgi:hypothetical protein
VKNAINHKGCSAAKPQPKESEYLPQGAKAAKKIPLSSPFGKKKGKEGDFA